MDEPDRWPEAAEVARHYLAAWGTIPPELRAWLPGGTLPEETGDTDVPDPTVGAGGAEDEDGGS